MEAPMPYINSIAKTSEMNISTSNPTARANVMTKVIIASFSNRRYVGLLCACLNWKDWQPNTIMTANTMTTRALVVQIWNSINAEDILKNILSKSWPVLATKHKLDSCLIKILLTPFWAINLLTIDDNDRFIHYYFVDIAVFSGKYNIWCKLPPSIWSFMLFPILNRGWRTDRLLFR